MKHLATICYVAGIALIVTQYFVPTAPHLNWIGIAIIAGAFLLPSEKKEETISGGRASTEVESEAIGAEIKADAFISADEKGFSILQAGFSEPQHYRWNAIESWSWTSDGPTMFMKNGGWIDVDFSTRDLLRFIRIVPKQEEEVSMICPSELRIKTVDSDGIVMESPESKYPLSLKWNEIHDIRFSEEDDGFRIGFSNGLGFGCWKKIYGLALLFKNAPKEMKPVFAGNNDEPGSVTDVTIFEVNKNEIAIEVDLLLAEMYFSWSDFSNIHWEGNYWAHLELKDGTVFNISYDDKLWLLLKDIPRNFQGVNYAFRDRLFLELTPCKICGCMAVPTQTPPLEFKPSVLRQTGSEEEDDDGRDEHVTFDFCLACENEVWEKPEFFRDGSSSEAQWLRDGQLYFFWLYERHLEKMSLEQLGDIFGFPRDPAYRVVVSKNEVEQYILEQNGSKS